MQRPFPTDRVFSVTAPEGCVDFFCYLPKTIDPARPPLVTVHGLSRNAAEQAFRFSALASDYGAAVIAPLFTRDAHRYFQKLAPGAAGRRSDEALLATLAYAESELDISFERPVFFGYSGGGQFTHRYAMLYPDRVAAAVLFAPGWYTFPDERRAYPYGIGKSTGLQDAPAPDLDRFCDIPIQVVIGTRDIARDASLNRNKKIDRLQGRTRLERARRWVAAMQEYAQSKGLTASVALTEVKGASHSFRRNVEKFNLIEFVFSYLYGQDADDGRQADAEAPRKDQCGRA